MQYRQKVLPAYDVGAAYRVWHGGQWIGVKSVALGARGVTVTFSDGAEVLFDHDASFLVQVADQ